MRIGDLKQRITFQEFTVTTNENGFEEKAWRDICTVWAAVSHLFGREYYEAAAVQAEETVKFTIRYITGIDRSMRIQFQDRLYNITSIDPIRYEKRFMEIKALEVTTDE